MLKRDFSELNERLKRNSEKVERILERFFPDRAVAAVLDSAAYGLFGGGKRLRAFLTLNGAERYGALNDNAFRLAAALEMIQAYSLIHDDLPCMDNDDMRRGKPSCHKVYGEAGALLAGDCLLNLAYETLLGGDFSDGYKKACLCIANAAGNGGMINGQYVELTSNEVDEKGIFAITKQKTGALFEASVLAPAFLANRPQSEIDILKDFAVCFGTAFQLADDIMDDEEKKHTEEMNFVSILGKEKTEEYLNSFSERAIKSLYDIGLNGSFEEQLVYYNLERKK